MHSQVGVLKESGPHRLSRIYRLVNVGGSLKDHVGFVLRSFHIVPEKG